MSTVVIYCWCHTVTVHQIFCILHFCEHIVHVPRMVMINITGCYLQRKVKKNRTNQKLIVMICCIYSCTSVCLSNTDEDITTPISLALKYHLLWRKSLMKQTNIIQLVIPSINFRMTDLYNFLVVYTYSFRICVLFGAG